jgi:hypothetical protein
MQANQAQGIIEFMPTLAERKSLREYMKTSKNGDTPAKSFERLCECEKFMVAMMTVKQSKRKIRALLFKLQFRGCIHDLAHGEYEEIVLRLSKCASSPLSKLHVQSLLSDVFSIEKACDEISNSVRLRKLFGIVLNIGNRLNTAGPGQKRKAGAFSVKSLLKLNQAKAFDNKTTFLHYVVLVVGRNSEALLDFKDDLPTVFKADKIYWDQCVSELEEVETQLENVRKIALYEAKPSKIMYQLPKTKSSEADNDSDDLSVDSMSLEEEVSLLRSTKTGMFALSAIRKVSQLRERVDMAKDKFVSLLKYLGESGDSKMQPHELFEIITTFCRTFNAVRADVEKMEKAKKRDEKKEKDSEAGTKNERLKAIQEIQTSPTVKAIGGNQALGAKKASPFLRASSHQPNLGNVFSDIKRVTASLYSSPGATSSPADRGHNNCPPKVTHLCPDDKSSPGSINMQRMQPSPQSSLRRIHESQAESKPAEEAIVRARAQRQIFVTKELVSPAKEAEDGQLAKDAAAAVADQAAERALQMRQQVAADAQEANRVEMLHRAEEVAAAKKAARITVQQRAEEEAAAEKVATLALQRQAEKAATANNTAIIAMQQRKHVEEESATEAASVEESMADSSCQSGPDPATEPMKRSPLTRREILASRRMSVRNRNFCQTTPPREPTSVVTPAHLPAQSATTKPTITTAEPSSPPRDDLKSSSTMARDRYARHKRLIQQRGR